MTLRARFAALVLAALLGWPSAARAIAFANISVAPACPLAGQQVTVTFDVEVGSWRASGDNYAIAVSSNSTPESQPTDTWYSLNMSGSCPGTGYPTPANNTASSVWFTGVQRVITLPGVLPDGPYYLIMIGADHSWIGNCTANQMAVPFNVCYYSPTPTTTPTPPNTPTVSPTGVQNVAQSTFGPSNHVAFIVVSPTHTPYGSPTSTPTVTVTVTRTPTRTASPTATPSATQSMTRTATPSATPTVTFSSTPSATPTATPSVTFSSTSTRTASPTATPTATPSVTFSSTSTRTATPTATPSFTQTNTFSPTPTPSHTPTATPTFTPSVTFSSTSTRTATPTATPTATTSVTFTPTETLTDSPTATPTVTPSVTFSSTSTRTATPTATPSSTQTVTFTPTETLTDSPTATPSSTQTNTFSPTPTPTDTRTATLTSTQTVTFTPTETLTDSPTATPSYTQTNTFSPTPTPSDTPTFTPTVTPSVTFSATRSMTDTPTDTPSATQTNTFSPTPTPSDTRTATLTSTRTVTFSPTETLSNTPTRTNTPTQSLTFTDTATRSVTRTMTPTSTRSETSTPSATRSATLTVTLTASPTPTSTETLTITPTHTFSPTPVPMPYQLKLTLYNSAGEVVLNLWEGGAQYGPTSLEMTSNSLAVGAGALGFIFQGALDGVGNGPITTLYWEGQNNGAQLVSGGAYYAKLEVTDSYGNVKAMIKEISVLRATQKQSLTVYNSAGEAVAHLMSSGSTGSRLVVKEAPKALELDPNTGLLAGGIEIELQNADGSVDSLTWQGLNDHGAPVAPGSYTIELVSEQAGGATVRESKQVVLLRAPSPSGLSNAVLAPQPWRDGPLSLHFKPLIGGTVQLRVYNMAGELVLSGYSPGPSGKLSLDRAGSLASGVYLVELSWLNGQALLERRAMKLAVAR